MITLEIVDISATQTFVPDVGANRANPNPFAIDYRPINDEDYEAIKAAQSKGVTTSRELMRSLRDAILRKYVVGVRGLDVRLPSTSVKQIDTIGELLAIEPKLSPTHSMIIENLYSEILKSASVEVPEKNG